MEAPELMGFDLKELRLCGLPETTLTNINQGKLHDRYFFFGKAVEIDGITTNLLVFSDGSGALDKSKLFHEEDFEIKGKIKTKKVFGEDEIKALGINYRFDVAHNDFQWSNKGIDFYVNSLLNGDTNKGVANVINADSVVMKGIGGKNKKSGKDVVKKIPSYIHTYINYTTTLIFALEPNQEQQDLVYSGYGIDQKSGLCSLIDGKDHIKAISAICEKYMDMPDPRIFDLISAYTLSTYCFSLFNSIGYLYFNAERGSGKTKFMDIIRLMCHKPQNATSPSESALFRSIESSRGTMLIDDFENLPKEKKNILSQILKVGYKRNGCTLRSEKIGDRWVSIKFDVFSPKIISNTTDLDPITVTRCIKINLVKTKSDKGRLDPPVDDPIWTFIRDSCYAWVMRNWKEVEKNYYSLEVPSLNNRDLELVKGLLAVAKTVSEDYFNELVVLCNEIFADRFEDFSKDWEYNIYSGILKFAPEGKELFTSVKDIQGWCCDEMGVFTDSAEAPPLRWVGRRLGMNPLFKRHRVSKGVQYKVSRELAADYMERHGWLFDMPEEDAKPEIEKVEH